MFPPCHPEHSRKGGERKISVFFSCGFVDARCEIAIRVIKNKIGVPQTLKGAYFISYLKIFSPCHPERSRRKRGERKFRHSLDVKL